MDFFLVEPLWIRGFLEAFEREQAACHVEPAGGQGESIDRRGVQHRQLVGNVGPIGLGGETLNEIVEIALQGGVAIGAAIGSQDAGAFAVLRVGGSDDARSVCGKGCRRGARA